MTGRDRNDRRSQSFSRATVSGAALAFLLILTPRAEALNDCHCYWSTDCKSTPTTPICDWLDNLSEENKCNWKKPKPANATEEIPACSQDDGDEGETGAGGDCDGLCVARKKSSNCETEDTSTLAQAIVDWGDACIDVAEMGGGAMDPVLVASAMGLPESPDCAENLGRHVGGTISALVGEWPGGDFFGHPSTVHEYQEHTCDDLSSDPCTVLALRTLISALASEVQTPNSGAEIVATIPSLCPGALDYVVPCPYLDDLDCLQRAVFDTGSFLSSANVPTTSYAGLLLLAAFLGVGGSAALLVARQRRRVR